MAAANAALAESASDLSSAALLASPEIVRDFMIADVCLTAAGAALPGVSPIDGDPRCATHRDLRPGESLPYHKHDHPSPAQRAGAPQGYQRHDSFPVETARFGTVVEDSFDFGAGEGRRFGIFDDGKGDGGDLVVLSPTAASIAATEDGGAGFQLFVGENCRGDVTPSALNDSWIIAAIDPSKPLEGRTVARLNDLREGAQVHCPTRFNAAFTHWYIQPFLYRSGPGQGAPIALTTLISEHYGGETPEAADHVERFYFTRELGSTRWERWQNTSHTHDFSSDRIAKAAADLAASGRCSPAPVPAGGPFAMVDCREWTLIERPENAGGDPPSFFIDAIRRRGEGAGLFAAP